MTATPFPLPVVLTPELVLRSFTDPACLNVLRSWRDGRIRPVLDRPLLRRYLQVLHRGGLDQMLVRRWLWWFASADKCHLEVSGREDPSSIKSHCAYLCRNSVAEQILCSDAFCRALEAEPPGEDAEAWLPATQLQDLIAEMTGG